MSEIGDYAQKCGVYLEACNGALRFGEALGFGTPNSVRYAYILRDRAREREAAALLAAMNASEDVAAPPAIEYHEAARPGAETSEASLDPNPVRED